MTDEFYCLDDNEFYDSEFDYDPDEPDEYSLYLEALVLGHDIDPDFELPEVD